MSRDNYKATWAKTRADNLKRQGLCVGCGVRPPVKDETRCQDCKDERNQRRRRRYADSPQMRLAANKAWRDDNPDKDSARRNRERRKVRLEVLLHYGGVCACCGEDHPAFLTIDHIDGGGSAHRRSISNNSIHRWLKINGFPPGFQVLCWNCNSAKHFYGECPHASVVDGGIDADIAQVRQ